MNGIGVSIIIILALLVALTSVSTSAQSGIWGQELEISMDDWTERQSEPSIAADDDELHVVWKDSGDGDWDIYYRYFDGSNWQPEREISSDANNEDQYNPSIAVEDRKTYVVWEEKGEFGDLDIYYRHFDGNTWQDEQEISTDDGVELQFAPSIATDNGEVYVAWVDESDGGFDIFYRHFDGNSWQDEQEVSTDSGSESQTSPSMFAENGEVYLVWQDGEDGDYDIYYRYFDGIAWQDEQEISTDNWSERQYNPSIAVDEGEVHVVWWDEGDGDWDIIYRHHNGTDWGMEQEISDDEETEDQHLPSIAAADSEVHVVWIDDQDEDGDIYYRHFDGRRWRTEQEISRDSGTEGQGPPIIAVGAGIVHVVWTDEGDGDYDLYYRSRTVGYSEEFDLRIVLFFTIPLFAMVALLAVWRVRRRNLNR